MADAAGRVNYTLLNSHHYLKDNRLLPAGFNKATVDADVAVAGSALQDADFAGGRDLVSYRVPTSGFTKPFTVKATFYYQTLSFNFKQDLTRDVTPEVARFTRMLGTADKMPVAMATALKTVN